MNVQSVAHVSSVTERTVSQQHMSAV